MLLKKLQVKNFRNLEEMVISFDKRISCIFGENGNGKTNLLEAIYVITERKSFRKNVDFAQFLSLNGNSPEVDFMAKFKGDDIISYSGKLFSKRAEYFLNGKLTKKKIDIRAIFINPFEFLYFYSTASFRRQWFDRAFSSLDEHYKNNLTRYKKVLKMRNTLLIKKPFQFKEQIKAMDKELSRYSFFLLKKRLSYADKFKNLFTPIFTQLFSEKHEIDIEIQSKFKGLTEEQIGEKLQEALPRDMLMGKTSYGVHLDDYMLLFDKLNAFEVCSFGQQKMSFLSLSFAYIELFKYKCGREPMVLIDDVSGELDKARWKNLVNYICDKKFQTFITTANEDFKRILEKMGNIGKLEVERGRVVTH